MLLLILAIILTIASFAILVFGFFYKPDTKVKKQKNSKAKQDIKDPMVIKLEEIINTLQNQLEKAKADYHNIQDELNLTKKKESELEQASLRQKEWQTREQLQLEKVKKESIKLREDLVNKEKELEKEFALNINLNRELKENKEKLTSLEKENKEMIDEIMMLKSKIVAYQKEIENQNKIILEVRKKEEESEWISKREYDILKRQLEECQELLKKLRSS